MKREQTSKTLATATADEIGAWNALSREEQLSILRAECSHPDCDKISKRTMSEILTLARERVARKLDAAL